MSEIERRRSYHPHSDKLITKQSEASDADINSIVARYIAHGDVPLTGGTPRYGDFSNFSDFHSALNQIQDAQRQFGDLPASVRGACDNDVGKFLDLVHDPERRAELEELGLVPERAPSSAPEPAPAVVEAPTPAE